MAGAFVLAFASSFVFARAGQSENVTTVVIHFSRFEPSVVTATTGEPITLRLRNDDPIAHEWIVGIEAIHERHRTGTEPYHDEVPTEVTIPALQSRTTTVQFDAPGDYVFICHLPGHEAYGMRGVLRVLPAD